MLCFINKVLETKPIFWGAGFVLSTSPVPTTPYCLAFNNIWVFSLCQCISISLLTSFVWSTGAFIYLLWSDLKLNGAFYFLTLLVFLKCVFVLANILRLLSNNRLWPIHFPSTDGKMLFSIMRHQRRMNIFLKFVVFYGITDLCALLRKAAFRSWRLYMQLTNV